MRASDQNETSLASYAMRATMLSLGPLALAYMGGPSAAWRGGGWLVRGLLLASLPPVVLCTSGLIEGTARTAIAKTRAVVANVQGDGRASEGFNNQAQIELDTTHGLARGILFPPTGYALGFYQAALMHAKAQRNGAPTRILVNDYLMYRVPYVVCRQGCKKTRKMAKLGWKATKFTARKVDSTLDSVGFYTACRATSKLAASMIAAGCGLAVSAFEAARPKWNSPGELI